MAHIAVLKREVLKYLDVAPGKNFVDCTIGEGEHTAAILKKNGPDGKVLGIELDPELYKKLWEKEIKNRLILINDSYTNLEKIIKKEKFGPVHGILFDLGLSSWHLEESGRGFSFLRDEPLDMRYNLKCQTLNVKCQKLTAAEIVNEWPKSEIEKVLRIYGEERFSKRISREIVKEREIGLIETTFQLVEVIKRAVPKNYEKGRIHPATRTFQALRIAVNNELKNLKETLPQTLNVLEPGGRLVLISFHSLEDRIVKFFLKEKARKNLLQILTKKPVRPSEKEMRENPRSRSAKLRAAQKA